MNGKTNYNKQGTNNMEIMKHYHEIDKLNIQLSNGAIPKDYELLYIDRLYCGLEAVEQNDITRISPESPIIPIEVIETTYAAALVAKVNQMISNENPLNLRCTPEDKKKMYLESIEDSHEPDKYPDLLIHMGDLPEQGIQEVVCEIKRFTMLSAKNMVVDLNKLITYSSSQIWNGHGYRFSVFIVTNTSQKELEKKVRRFWNYSCSVKNLLKNNNKRELAFGKYVTENMEKLKNIICFCHHKEGEIDMCTVFDLVRNKIGK